MLLIVDVGEGVLSVDSSPVAILGVRVRPSAEDNDVLVLFFFEVVRGVGRGSDFEVFLSIRWEISCFCIAKADSEKHQLITKRCRKIIIKTSSFNKIIITT